MKIFQLDSPSGILALFARSTRVIFRQVLRQGFWRQMSFYIWSSPYSALITRKLRWKSYELIIFSSSTHYQTHCSSSQQPTMSNSLEYLGFILKNFLVQKRNWFPHHLSFCPKCILAQKKFAYFRFTKERQQKSWRRRGNFGSIPYFGSLKINLTQRVRALEKSFFIIFWQSTWEAWTPKNLTHFGNKSEWHVKAT